METEIARTLNKPGGEQSFLTGPGLGEEHQTSHHDPGPEKGSQALAKSWRVTGDGAWSIGNAQSLVRRANSEH